MADVSRETKLARTIHAETNAILFADRSVEGYWIFTTRPPCSSCAGLIIQSGISHVAFYEPDAEFMERWGTSVAESVVMFHEAGVRTHLQQPFQVANVDRRRS
jgi:dCMP deaminase